MGNGMDRIIPGLYVGNIRDSCDRQQINKNNITHIISIHDDAKPGPIENVTYLCYKASDHASQDLKQFFVETIEFIHSARLNNGNVLVHCLAGVSRSATIAIAYIMTVTSLPWYDAMNAARAARDRVNPNFGFQRQLQNFEFTTIKKVREDLFKKFGPYDHTGDLSICKSLLEQYHTKQQEFVENSNNQQQVNAKTLKTYPLAFNSYNLDDEKNEAKTRRKKPSSDQSNSDQPNEKDNEQEKNIVMEKIFS